MLTPMREGNVLVFADSEDRLRPLERWILSVGLKPVLLGGREKFLFDVGDDDTIDAIVTDLDTDHPETGSLFHRLISEELFPGVPQLHIVRDPALHGILQERSAEVAASSISWPFEPDEWKNRLILVSEIGRLRRRLQRSVIEDPVTGVWNRRYLRFRLDQEFSRARRYRTPISLVIFDVDHFSEINERFGQDAADLALREFGRRLREYVRQEDLCGHLGSTSFGVLLAGTRFRGAAVFANKVRSSIASHPMVFGKHAATLQVSAGISAFPASEQVHRVEDLIERAEQALREAKNRGRNRVHIDSAILDRERPLILLVDHDPAWLEAASVLLSTADYRVVTAQEAEAAIPIAHEADPDLIVLDLGLANVEKLFHGLPGADTGGRPPCIGLAREPASDPAPWQEWELDRFITKPFSLTLLIGTIRELTVDSAWL